jgi:hypothetical protein
MEIKQIEKTIRINNQNVVIRTNTTSKNTPYVQNENNGVFVQSQEDLSKSSWDILKKISKGVKK